MDKTIRIWNINTGVCDERLECADINKRVQASAPRV